MNKVNRSKPMLVLMLLLSRALPAQTPPQSNREVVHFKVDHVSIGVDQFETMLEWYQAKLGFQVEAVWDVEGLEKARLAYLTKNGFRIELVKGGTGKLAGRPKDFAEHFDRRGLGHICFEVENLDALMKHLGARGVPAFVAAKTYRLKGTDLERRVGFILNPEGNVIEFGEPLRTAPGR